MRESRTSDRQVAAALKRQRILELRTLGQTLEQIGQDPAVGLNKANVLRQLNKALDDLAHDQAEKTGRLKTLAYSRLERLLGKAMLLGLGGNIRAMHQAERLIMAQARVMGFDAPIKHTQTDPTGNEERVAPGTYVLAMPPAPSLEEWQAQAANVWQAQRERDEASQ